MRKKLLKVTLLALIAVECVLCALHAFYRISDSYQRTIESYASNYAVIHLQNMPENQAEKALSLIKQQAEQQQIPVIRKDQIKDSVDGGAGGIRLGIETSTSEAVSHIPALTFMGNTLFNEEDIALLLQSEPHKTLGLENTQPDVLKEIPSFPGQSKLVIYKLADLEHFANGNSKLILSTRFRRAKL